MRYQFGINSQHFWNLARGIDSRSVVPDRHAKSISHETTFSRDICEVATLRAWILELADQVARRLRRYDILARTVNLKIRYSDFHTLSRASSLKLPTNLSNELSAVAAEVLVKALAPNGQQSTEKGIRLLGMGVSNLSRPTEKTQQLLFGQKNKDKQNRIDQASDEIKDKFGNHAVRRASSIEKRVEHRQGPLLDD